MHVGMIIIMGNILWVHGMISFQLFDVRSVYAEELCTKQLFHTFSEFGRNETKH